jgi:hypothetical protein
VIGEQLCELAMQARPAQLRASVSRVHATQSPLDASQMRRSG